MLKSIHARDRSGPPSAVWRPAAGALKLLAVAFVVALLMAALAGGTAMAQDATPPILPPGDPRSEGEGPGFGSGPLLAALIVVGLGAVAATLAIAYVRFTGRR